jgi:integrase
MVSFWRSFWRFLVKAEAVPPGSEPFALVELPPVSRKEAANKGWTPFPREAVALLINAARAKEDPELVDLITLGAYTGARIEELCALKLADIGAASFQIIDSKTAAGVREVPIHAALVPLLERLRVSSQDGYLLSGLTFNKYGDRSNAIGKRFGRMKTALGFGSQEVFHSLRGTLVTALENAGVSENLAADIVGHEKPRITYGLYSGGASLEVKAAALAKVSYPGL